MQVGSMLRLPQLTIATAAVYLQRFFMRYSMVDIPQRPGMHPYPAAATSLFLATKVEENPRKMREFVVACCRVGMKQPNLVVDEQSKEFWKWRDTILHHEDLLLEALCFDIQLEQPYRILYDFLCFFGMSENRLMRNASWAFVNDSMYTVLCLQFTARIIAAAALYAAAVHCGIGFEDDDTGQVWWEQIDVDLPTVRRACARMTELCESNPVQRHSQNYPTTPIPVPTADEGLLSEKTRIARPGIEPVLKNDGRGATTSTAAAGNISKTPSRIPRIPAAAIVNDKASNAAEKQTSSEERVRVEGTTTAAATSATSTTTTVRLEVAEKSSSRRTPACSPSRSVRGGSVASAGKRAREPEPEEGEVEEEVEEGELVDEEKEEREEGEYVYSRDDPWKRSYQSTDPWNGGWHGGWGGSSEARQRPPKRPRTTEKYHW